MTKSQLFKKAHALAKVTIKAGDDYRATFGLCLKAIIAESKAPALPALVGSEKQVKWADDIRVDGIRAVTYFAKLVADNAKELAKSESDIINFERVVKTLNDLAQNNKASDWIDNRFMVKELFKLFDQAQWLYKHGQEKNHISVAQQVKGTIQIMYHNGKFEPVR